MSEIKTTDFSDRYSFFVEPDGLLCVHRIHEGNGTIGVFYHRKGTVDIYQIQDLTVLSALRSDGRVQERSWKKDWSRRTLSRLCRAFLHDLQGPTQ